MCETGFVFSSKSRKGGHSVIMQGGSFHRCVHQIAWTREWRQGSGRL